MKDTTSHFDGEFVASHLSEAFSVERGVIEHFKGLRGKPRIGSCERSLVSMVDIPKFLDFLFLIFMRRPYEEWKMILVIKKGFSSVM